jgi:hypothetical protein
MLDRCVIAVGRGLRIERDARELRTLLLLSLEALDGVHG